MSAVDLALERIAQDTANAVIRPEAEAGARPALAGPLAHLPVVVKANLCREGRITDCCSRMLADFRPPYTATAVARLEAAGAVIVGTGNMDEFAMGSSNETSIHGPVNHPSAPERVPGGSSGGCAAAVAAGLVPLALGSDTGGSIRQPAALCGCVGLKPTYGRVSRYGLVAFGSSLDQIGPLAANVATARTALRAIAGHDPLDSTSVARPADDLDHPRLDNLAGLRIGFVPAHRAHLQPAVGEALDRASRALAAAGAELVAIDLPHEPHAVACYYVIATAEAASNLARYDGVHYGHRAAKAGDLAEVYERSRGEGFGIEVKRRVIVGNYVLSAGYFDAYYRQAARVRALIQADFTAAFDTCDLILGPTSPTVAWKRGERLEDPLAMYLSDQFTIAANLAGIPALSLPTGDDQNALPTAVQLQAPAWQEGRLLAVAECLETALAPT